MNLVVILVAGLSALSLQDKVTIGSPRRCRRRIPPLPSPANHVARCAAVPCRRARIAILDGDPAKAGPFVMRLKFPDGYRVLPHTHPQTERVTVLSGTLHIGMGATFDKKASRAMPAGSFGSWPAGMNWAEGETIIQLNGIGPWEIHYVNPADDPRQTKK